MSHAHTTRRKTIARFKRQYPKNWLAKFHDHCQATRKALDGPCVGSLQDVINQQTSTLPKP